MKIWMSFGLAKSAYATDSGAGMFTDLPIDVQVFSGPVRIWQIPSSKHIVTRHDVQFARHASCHVLGRTSTKVPDYKSQDELGTLTEDSAIDIPSHK